LSAPESAAVLAALPGIPRNDNGPAFPAPWTARVFAFAVTLHGRGLFAWPEFSKMLGAKIAAATNEDAGDPEAYWRAWLAALEAILAEKGLATPGDLHGLQEAWRRAAEATPHGAPIELCAAARRSSSGGNRAGEQDGAKNRNAERGE
jgi:nitrile hydratase accessory protein